MTNKTNEPITFFSMFSGIGGFEYGLQQSKHNFKNVGFSEIEPSPISIYLRHFPNHKQYGDATKIQTKYLSDFDFLVGGFPCQAFSIAGRRKGFDDTRGTLFFEIARILKDKRPRYFLLENVKGLLNHDKGKTFQTILEILNELRYDVSWRIYNSKNYGVPQNRERVFIKGYLRGKCGREILHQTRNSIENPGKLKTYRDKNRTYSIYDNSHTLSRTLTRTGQNNGFNHLIKLEDNRKINIHGYTRPSKSQSTIVYDSDGLMGTLCGNNKSQPKIKEYDHPRMNVIGNIRPSGHSEGNIYGANGLSSTITRSNVPFIEDNKTVARPVLTPDRVNKRQNGRRMKEDGEPSFTLTATDRHGVYDGYRIRRLTPVECERLQAFPDNWTKYGKDGELISDTQRYMCLGNAVTTSVITAIVDDMFECVSCDNTRFKSVIIRSILKRIKEIINPYHTKTEILIYCSSMVRVYNERNKVE